MNEKNLEYLKKTLEGLGFGTKLNDVLETAIRREMTHFSLGISSLNKPLEIKEPNAPKTEHLNFTLNFNRSKDSDMYFLNDYMVLLKKKDDPIARVQTFDLERDYRITALQAYKLLSGLSFEKEVYLRTKADAAAPTEKPEKTPLWFRLNLDITDAYANHPLRTFRPEYGYDMAEALGKYPLKGLEAEDKMTEAMKNLRNGNYYHTELLLNKKTVPVTIAANPQMKTIDIYDKNMVEIRDETIFPERAAARNMAAETNRKSTETLTAGPTVQPWAEEPGQEQQTERTRGR